MSMRGLNRLKTIQAVAERCPPWARSNAVACGNAHARARLIRLIGIEVVLVLAVRALVASWRFTPPPRAIVHKPMNTAQSHLHRTKRWWISCCPRRPTVAERELDRCQHRFRRGDGQ